MAEAMRNARRARELPVKRNGTVFREGRLLTAAILNVYCPSGPNFSSRTSIRPPTLGE